MSPREAMRNLSNRLKRRLHPDDQDSSPPDTPQVPTASASTSSAFHNPSQPHALEQNQQSAIAKSSASKLRTQPWKKHPTPLAGSGLLSAGSSSSSSSSSKVPAFQHSFASGPPPSQQPLATHNQNTSAHDKLMAVYNSTMAVHTSGAAHNLFPPYGSSFYPGSGLLTPLGYATMNSQHGPFQHHPAMGSQYVPQPGPSPVSPFHQMYLQNMMPQGMPIPSPPTANSNSAMATSDMASTAIANPATANPAMATLGNASLTQGPHPSKNTFHSYIFPPPLSTSSHYAAFEQFQQLDEMQYELYEEDMLYQQFALDPSALWQDNDLPAHAPQHFKGYQTIADDCISCASSESSVNLEESAVNPSLIDNVTEALEPLQQFVRNCLGRTCAGCFQGLAAGVEDVGKMTKSWAEAVLSPDAIIGKKRDIVLGWKCHDARCSILTCPGCGADISQKGTGGRSGTFEISGIKFTAKWCCDDGRLMAIWALASGYTKSTSKPRHKSRAANKVKNLAGPSVPKPPPAFKIGQSARPQGVGYATGRGMSYLPTKKNNIFSRPGAQMWKRAVDHEAGTRSETKFRLAALLVSSYKLESSFGVAPPDFLWHVVSRSVLVKRVAKMLSANTINEIALHQHGIYDAALDFLDAIGNHPAIYTLLYGDRVLFHGREGKLLHVSLGLCKNKAVMVAKDTGKSLFDLLGGLVDQAHTVTKHASANSGTFETRDGQKLLKLSRRLIQFSASHAAGAKQYKTETASSIADPKTEYADWHRENCLSDVPDEQLLHNFSFAMEVNRGLAADTAPGRMKRLITELSTLRTSLPEGIFIRHGSSRLDVMKVLIIGPKGTPYESGFFEFDLYCTPSYPNQPPVVRFRTTNQGKVRFNPNLYEDGTVCLSLLGTWAGEPWRPNQSTILQILVSIQSMIFCENPWYNEPGRENRESLSQSAKYNDAIRVLTSNYAIHPWVETLILDLEGKFREDASKKSNNTAIPNEPSLSIWKDTALTYLKVNSQDIISSTRGALLCSMDPTVQQVTNTMGSVLQAGGSSS
ncbi:hypothetical protein GGR53DRAFT_54214 [Hypoxylon sp. FL1150]|nr:hypothetical protein GGR53DRAFT_54214 [Hypoxylon sp. FL1150]